MCKGLSVCTFSQSKCSLAEITYVTSSQYLLRDRNFVPLNKRSLPLLWKTVGNKRKAEDHKDIEGFVLVERPSNMRINV